MIQWMLYNANKYASTRAHTHTEFLLGFAKSLSYTEKWKYLLEIWLYASSQFQCLILLLCLADNCNSVYVSSGEG